MPFAKLFCKKDLHFSKITKIPLLWKSCFKFLNKHKNYFFNPKTWIVTADKPGTSPDSSSLSCRGTIWRRAPLPAPLLSTSTLKLPKTTLTQVRTQEKSELLMVWCVCVFHSLPRPLIYIGGSQGSCVAMLQLILP